MSSLQLSFADQEVSINRKQTRAEVKLSKINRLVDWQKAVDELKVLYKSGKQGGRRPKDILPKIKMLFIQHLYNLSDPELEDQVHDRLSFQRFCGLSLSDEIVDFTTLWRLKERMVKANVDQHLFNQINEELDRKGLFVKKGTIIDASVIESSNRPLSKKKRSDLEQTPSSQIDTDATSTAKRGKYYFGHKGHIGVDQGSKLIRKQKFTTASLHDSQVNQELTSGDEQALFADSAYSNKADKRACREKNLYYGVLDKGTRKKPLSKSQKARNKRNSSIRSAVEHPFAYMKKQMNYLQCRAKNIDRNRLLPKASPRKWTMNCIIYNLMRADYLLAKAS